MKKFNEIQREKMVTAIKEGEALAEKIGGFAVVGLTTDLLDSWGINTDYAFFKTFWEAKEYADVLKDRYIKHRRTEDFYAIYVNGSCEYINA